MSLGSQLPVQSTSIFLPNRSGLCLIDAAPWIAASWFLTANISPLPLDAGEALVDGIHARSVHAWLGDGRMIAHNCFTDADLALQRGNLSISYDWWDPGTFSVQANIAQGNGWAFLPSEAAFHLVAETAYGRIGNDFDDSAVARPVFAEAAKIDMLVNGGGKAAIKVGTTNGDIKIVEANP